MRTRVLSLAVLSAMLLMISAENANAQEKALPLKWEQMKNVAQAAPADEKAIAKYAFKNIGDCPVRIVKVRTTCGCIVARADKDVYAPGELGVLTATFVFGNRTGRHVNQIWVIADNGETREMALELDVTIPPLLRIEPVVVVWKADEQAQQKAVRVRNAQDKPVKISGITCDQACADATIETVAPGKEYQIIITPKPHSRRVETILLIRTDFPAGSPRIFSVRLIMEAPAT